MQGNGRTPGVADHDGLVDTSRIQNLDDVERESVHAEVAFSRNLRTGRIAVTSLIDHDHMRQPQTTHDWIPVVHLLRESVEQNHRQLGGVAEVVPAVFLVGDACAVGNRDLHTSTLVA